MLFVKIQKIINFIYPPQCFICDKLVMTKGLCSVCFNSLKAPIKYCISCGFILPKDALHKQCGSCVNKDYFFNYVYYKYSYSPQIFTLVNKFKDNDAMYLSKYISKTLSDIILHNNQLLGYDIIIPTPMHFFKLMKRKYNHIAILAKQISKNVGIPSNMFILKKIKNTKNQKFLSQTERLKNVKGSFDVSNKYKDLIKGKKIILLDDIITTGSTIYECSKVLKKYNAKEVAVLSLARVDGILKI